MHAGNTPILWTMHEPDLALVDGSGHSQRGLLAVDAANSIVQAARGWIGLLGKERSGADLTLLAPDGSVVSEAEIPGAYQSQLWLGAESVAYSPGHEDLDGQRPWLDGVLLQSGGKTVLDGWIPRGPMVAGTLPVCATDESSCGWLEVPTGELTGTFPVTAWWSGQYMIWIDGFDLVVATPTTEHRWKIGFTTVLDWRPDVALVGSAWSPTAIVSLDSGDQLPITALPDGWHSFNDSQSTCWNQDWEITSDGRVLGVLRNDQVAQVWRYDPANETWDPIGSPLADVAYVYVRELDGTVQIFTVDGAATFCTPHTFVATADALVGESVQVLRPDEAMEWVDPPWAYDESGGWPVPPLALHAGGMCAVNAQGDGVIDLVTGKKFALGSIAAGWLD